MAKDYYDVLGVSKNSSKEEIKKSYKNLAKKYHPDLNKTKDAEGKFKEISEAYAVLSDDNKRKQYDQFGHSTFNQRYSEEDIFRGAHFEDIFGDMFGDNVFEMFFGGGGRRSRKGKDLRYDLTLDFEEAIFGCEKDIELIKKAKCEECDGEGGELDVCSECNGRGQVKKSRNTMFGSFVQITTCSKCHGEGRSVKKKCKVCDGEGAVRKEKRLKIKIPAGVDGGSQLRVPKEGEPGARGSYGDLYVLIHVNPSEIFKRDGNDIYVNLPVSFSQAALGDVMNIPSLKGDVKLKIPAGVQSGIKFRLNGKGVPYLDGYGHGDQYIIINIVTPTNINKEQKKIFEKLKDFEGKKSIIDKIKDYGRGIFL